MTTRIQLSTDVDYRIQADIDGSLSDILIELNEGDIVDIEDDAFAMGLVDRDLADISTEDVTREIEDTQSITPSSSQEAGAAVATLSDELSTDIERQEAVALLEVMLDGKVDQTVFDALFAGNATDAELAAVEAAINSVNDAQDTAIAALEDDRHPDDDVETVTGTAVDTTDARNPIVDLPTAVQVAVDDALENYTAEEVEGILAEIAVRLTGIVNTAITAIDLRPTANENEFVVEITWTDGDGVENTTTDPTPIIIPTSHVADAQFLVGAIDADALLSDLVDLQAFHFQAGNGVVLSSAQPFGENVDGLGQFGATSLTIPEGAQGYLQRNSAGNIIASYTTSVGGTSAIAFLPVTAVAPADPLNPTNAEILAAFSVANVTVWYNGTDVENSAETATHVWYVDDNRDIVLIQEPAGAVTTSVRFDPPEFAADGVRIIKRIGELVEITVNHGAVGNNTRINYPTGIFDPTFAPIVTPHSSQFQSILSIRTPDGTGFLFSSIQRSGTGLSHADFTYTAVGKAL